MKSKAKGIKKVGEKDHLSWERRQTVPSEPDLIGVSSAEEHQNSSLNVGMG